MKYIILLLVCIFTFTHAAKISTKKLDIFPAADSLIETGTVVEDIKSEESATDSFLQTNGNPQDIRRGRGPYEKYYYIKNRCSGKYLRIANSLKNNAYTYQQSIKGQMSRKKFKVIFLSLS